MHASSDRFVDFFPFEVGDGRTGIGAGHVIKVFFLNLANKDVLTYFHDAIVL